MIKAYVLVVTNPGETKHVFHSIEAVPGVTECHEVMGPYDIVAEVEISEMTEMTAILRQKIRAIEGVKSTVTCVAMQ